MGANFGKDFKAAHPEEVGADGVIRVCIGGGAGFIGSHIAKKLMAEVNITSTHLRFAQECLDLASLLS